MAQEPGITDFHTHAFPDDLAERAIRTLEAETREARAHLDGRLGSLLASMDRAGIARSVVCSIATKPRQFEPILAWSRQIASDRIVPFASVHPRDPDACRRVEAVREAGIRGIKLHPYYQDFYLDEDAAIDLYRAIAANRLILVCHTGFDIAFPRVRRCDPARIAAVLDRVPDLTLVTTHVGSWEDWNGVRAHLLGRPVYMEISFSLPYLGREAAKAMLEAHPAGHLLFGTDSPWQDQRAALDALRALELEPARERALLRDNAARLLDGAA